MKRVRTSVKAIVIELHKMPNLHDRKKTLESVRTYAKWIQEDPAIQTTYAPVGTMAMADYTNHIGGIPVNNFTLGAQVAVVLRRMDDGVVSAISASSEMARSPVSAPGDAAASSTAAAVGSSAARHPSRACSSSAMSANRSSGFFSSALRMVFLSSSGMASLIVAGSFLCHEYLMPYSVSAFEVRC